MGGDAVGLIRSSRGDYDREECQTHDAAMRWRCGNSAHGFACLIHQTFVSRHC
ncbi:hypothetical protein RRSWK_06116 [Rhodopirellula sp. SWK7]|nr:hypothetical protein RRSWK_06116 [Rhodopirellula sp. SWK7]